MDRCLHSCSDMVILLITMKDSDTKTACGAHAARYHSRGHTHSRAQYRTRSRRKSAGRLVDPQKNKEVEVEDGGRRHQLHNVEKTQDGHGLGEKCQSAQRATKEIAGSRECTRGSVKEHCKGTRVERAAQSRAGAHPVSPT